MVPTRRISRTCSERPLSCPRAGPRSTATGTGKLGARGGAHRPRLAADARAVYGLPALLLESWDALTPDLLRAHQKVLKAVETHGGGFDWARLSIERWRTEVAEARPFAPACGDDGRWRHAGHDVVLGRRDLRAQGARRGLPACTVCVRGHCKRAGGEARCGLARRGAVRLLGLLCLPRGFAARSLGGEQDQAPPRAGPPVLCWAIVVGGRGIAVATFAAIAWSRSLNGCRQ